MPDWKRVIAARLQELSVEIAPAADVIEELDAHLQDRYDELCAAGLDERSAADAVSSELTDDDLRNWVSGRRRTPQTARAAPLPVPSSGRWFADWPRDLRFAARVLARNPGFAIIVILTLGFGIAANTTAFTVLNSILLGPLPVARASELVELYTRSTTDPARDGARLPLSYPNLEDVRAGNTVFSSLAGHSNPLSVTETGDARPQRMFAELVTGNYFETLGLRPLMGRFFSAEVDRGRGAHPVLVLGHAAWQARFGSRPDIVGRTIRINGTVFTVIGVAPEGFKGLNAVFGPDVWIPATMTEQVVPAQMRSWLDDRAALGFRAVARLKPGVTWGQVESSVRSLASALEHDHPSANRDRTIAIAPVSRASLLGMTPQAAGFGSLALMAVPGLVLLIACSNVANLLFARATARRQEVAVRMALGAGRARLVRQLITESALLGLLAGVAGIGFAYLASRLLWSFRPAEFARNLVDVRFDVTVVLFAVAVSIVTIVIFGVAPALEASRPDLVTTLKDDVRTVGQHRRLVTWRHALLVGQVALSFMALMTAALFLRSIQRSYAMDPGFDREHLGIVFMSPGQSGYDRPRAERLYQDIRSRLEALPGVTAMSLATNMPLFADPSRRVVVAGHEDARDANANEIVVNTVDRDYFAATGITLLEGRDFTEADRSGRPVAIVNDVLARRYWPERDAIGQHFTFAGDPTVREVVGIAETANYTSIGEAPQPCAYLPLSQNFADAVILYVRTAGDPAATLPTVQREIGRIDSDIDVSDARTARRIVDEALFTATMGVGLLGVFGLVALALASLGLYGVMSHGVALRQQEIAVRMALGASRAALLRLIVRQGLTLVGTGLVLGAGGSVLVGLAFSRFLFGVSAFDPIALAGSAIVLMIVAALACYLPARRASRMDPLVALRTT